VKLFKRGVVIRESIGDECDPSGTALNHLLLAYTLEELGELAEAQPYYNRAFELYHASFGPQHPRTLSLAVKLAASALERGDQSRAIDLLEGTRMLINGAAETVGPQVSPADLNNLGYAFWLRGDYATARRLYELALSRRLEPTTLNNLGMIAERLGEYTAAVKHYRDALSALQEQRASHWRSVLQARILNNLGVGLTMAGDTALGARYLNEALAMRLELQGEESPEYAVTLRNLGLVAQREGRLNDAQRLIEQGRDLLACAHGVRGTEYAHTMQILGELLAGQGDDDAGLNAIEITLDIRRTVLGPDHPDTAVTFCTLARILRRKGLRTEACEALLSALPIFERRMGADHPWTIQLREESKPCLADSEAFASRPVQTEDHS